MPKNNKSTPIYVRIDNIYLDFIDNQVEKKIYGGRGHAINFALKELFEKRKLP